MKFPESNFWNFSLTFYQLPEVEKNCLALQDEHQLNVNLILFCHWLAIEKKQALNKDQWHELISASLPWEEIIKALRQSRRMITNSSIAWPTDFKYETSKGVTNIELNTEHMQQLSIEQAWQAMDIESSESNIEDLISENIKNYLIAANCAFSIDDISVESGILLKAGANYNVNNQTIAL